LTTSANGDIARRVLDRLEAEILVVDAAGAILLCNHPGSRLLSTNDGVFSCRGNLAFRDCGNSRWFRSVLSSLLLGKECEPTALISDDRSAQRRLVSVDLLDHKPGERSHFLVTFLRTDSTSQEGQVRRLMQHFGLTPAEQRLTLFLSAGGRLKEAAGTFNLSRHTVRNQLRSVFEKVGVRRQAELARLMCSGFQIRAAA
jgi:DNA-binding CsgD family transcriptional regulator